jgi:hypothetical protein
MLLIRAFIKHKNFIIQGHEDDRSAAEDVNLLNYDFEKFNYKVRSFSSCLYGMFLSYKIERPIFEHGDLDSRFSLNAISNRPLDLDEFSVELDERKLQYLQSQKSGSLKCANFSALSASQIAGQIRQKVQQNYIYNLARSTNGKTVKFNVVIENKGLYRNQCAVEYLPSEKILRLITFF